MVYRATSNTRNADLVFSARNVVARRLNQTTPPTDLGPEVCEGASGEPLGEQVTFYVLQVSGSRTLAQATWAGGQEGTGFDLVGPSPPGDVSLGVGENQLTVLLGGVDEDVDRLRFRAFCVPATPSVDAGTDAAVEDTSEREKQDGSGIDAGVAEAEPAVGIPPPCAQPELRENELPPLDSRYECGEARGLRT